MKTLDPGLAEHVAGGVTTLCRCWRLERKDGTVVGFTDHDGDLVFDELTYAAASGFTATSIEDQLGLAVSNLDAEGALLSDALTEDDLYAGRWDGATITIWLVNWQDVSQRVVLRAGFLGEVSRGTVAFTAELRGLTAPLDQAAGRVFQRRCAWELGDARCTVDLTADGRHGNGTVTQVIGAFDFVAGGLDAISAGVFTRGKLVWTSGVNEGLAVEIKSHSVGIGATRLSLFLPMGDAMVMGDTFTITAGCDKGFATCRDRFSNAVNFGGFPHMQGNDFALSYPTSGDQNDGGVLN
jgi:uncharacterized phage protein (TIGR02218 family)